MSEDLKINVQAAGAREAQAQLQGVAAAEKAVTGAATEAAGGVEKKAKASDLAATASEELRMRDRALLAELKALGPEASVAADIINVLANKTTTAGVAFGLIGAAVGAMSLAISSYNEHQAETKRKAEDLTESLKRQADAYLALIEAAARASRGRGDPEAYAAQALDIAGEYGLGKAGISYVNAELAKSGGRGAEAIGKRAVKEGYGAGDSNYLAALFALERIEAQPKAMSASEIVGRIAPLEGKSPSEMFKYLFDIASGSRQAEAEAMVGKHPLLSGMEIGREYYEQAGWFAGSGTREMRVLPRAANVHIGGNQFYNLDGIDAAGARRQQQAP
ncbi:MAG: hypothetical protein WC789_13795 [Lentisphaeria bacterium]